MKRLIKQCEIISGTNDYGKYMELFINPTYREIDIVFDESQYGSVRGLIYDDGTTYIWPGDILHNNVNNAFRGANLDINQFRFSYDNGLQIDLHQKWTYEKGKEILDQHMDFIRDITTTNNIVLFNGNGSSEYRKKLNDIKVASINK